MNLEDDDDDVPSEVLFFSKRAKLCAKVTPEDLKATAEMLSKMDEEKAKVSPELKEVKVATKRGSKRTVKQKKTDSDPEKEISIVDEVESMLSTPTVTLSAVAKRRLRKQQVERDLELKEIEEANRRAFSEIESSKFESSNKVQMVPEEEELTYNNLTVITVSCLSEVSRFTCRSLDKFSTIFPRVAELFKLKISEFLLSHNQRIIKVDDTVKSLNISASDVLECIPYKPEEHSKSEEDANSLKIIFQASDSKEKVDILVHKLEKMKEVMEKYSKLRSIPLDLLSFEFDGEKLEGDETPDDLEMDSGSCVDVRVSTSGEKNMKNKGKKKSAEVVTIDSDTFDDSDSDIICEEC